MSQHSAGALGSDYGRFRVFVIEVVINRPFCLFSNQTVLLWARTTFAGMLKERHHHVRRQVTAPVMRVIILRAQR